MIEPMHRLLYGRSGQLAGDRAASLPAGDQAGVGQHIEMLHHGRQRHRQRCGQFAHRHGILRTEPRQQAPPRAVGQRAKDPIEPIVYMLNHLV